MYLVKFQVGDSAVFSFWRKMNYIPKELSNEFYELCKKEFPAYCHGEDNYMRIATVVDLDSVKEIE